MHSRKVVYAAILSPGSSCVPRLRGLQSLGLDIRPLDTTALFGSRMRLLNSLTQRIYFSPSAIALNRYLLQSCREHKPDLLWIDKGNWVYPFVLRQIRSFVPLVIHYNTDDIFAPRLEFWLHKTGIRLYDLCLTTNRWNVTEIGERYGVRAIRAGMGYNKALLQMTKSFQNTNKSPHIFFGGHWEPDTEKYIIALEEAGLSVQLKGYNWWKASNPHFRQVHPATHNEFFQSMISAQIGLCILSKKNRNDSAGRSFEIPALGTFLLAVRTGEHSFLYGEGEGAALFSSEDELVEKARYYLANVEERQCVAAEGHRRCLTLGLSWEEHIQREWRIVERMLFKMEPSLTVEDDAPFWQGFRQGKDWDGTKTPWNIAFNKNGD